MRLLFAQGVHSFFLSCTYTLAAADGKAADGKAATTTADAAAAAGTAKPATTSSAVATAAATSTLARDADYKHKHASLLQFSESFVHQKLLHSARDHSASDALLVGDGASVRRQLTPTLPPLILPVSEVCLLPLHGTQACGACRCSRPSSAAS